MLARSLKKTNEELSDKLDRRIYNIAKELGKPQATTARPQTELLLSEIAEPAARRRTQLETSMIEMQTEFAIMKSRIEDPQIIEMQVEETLAAGSAVSHHAAAS